MEEAGERFLYLPPELSFAASQPRDDDDDNEYIRLGIGIRIRMGISKEFEPRQERGQATRPLDNDDCLDDDDDDDRMWCSCCELCNGCRVVAFGSATLPLEFPFHLR